MIPHVLKVSSLAGGADGVLRPSQKHCDLSDVEWSGAVLEHLWNKTAVHDRGSLVILRLRREPAHWQIVDAIRQGSLEEGRNICDRLAELTMIG